MTVDLTHQKHKSQKHKSQKHKSQKHKSQNYKSQEQMFPRRMSYGLFGLAIAVLGLMALGSATRVMNAGLSCPDWPLCYGQVIPQQQMNLQVFLEWFHRLVATTIGFGTIAALGIAIRWRSQLPKWLPFALGFALLLVIGQGVLGALTVTELLRFDIVTAHLGTGLAFFMTLLTIATSLLPIDRVSINLPSWLWKIGLFNAAVIYGQSLLGGLVATRWAVHQCFGQQQLCQVMHNHLWGILPTTATTIALVILGLRSPALPDLLRKLLYSIGLLLLVQLGLGYATFRLHLQVEPLTVLHQGIGATLLGAILLFTLLSYRLQTLPSQTFPSQTLPDFSQSPQSPVSNSSL